LGKDIFPFYPFFHFTIVDGVCVFFFVLEELLETTKDLWFCIEISKKIPCVYVCYFLGVKMVVFVVEEVET